MSGPSEFEKSSKTFRTPRKDNPHELNPEPIGIDVFKSLMYEMKDQIVIELSSKLNENTHVVQEAVKSQKAFEKNQTKNSPN
jgi:hypothetical protein